MNRSNVLAEIEVASDQVRLANDRLASTLLAVHDSKHWTDLTYADLALVMGVSRQAVQQRVLTLLQRGAGAKRRVGVVVHPEQLALDEKP